MTHEPAETADLAQIQRSIQEGDTTAARSGLAFALEAHPSDGRVWFLAGLLAERLGDSRDAAAAFRRSVELAPGVPQAHNNLGYHLLQSGELQAAQRELEAALAAKPDYVLAWRNLLDCMGRQGQEDEALHRLRRSASSPSLLALHSQYAFRLARYAEAFESAAAVVASGRFDEDAVHNLVACALRSLRCRAAYELLLPHREAMASRASTAFAFGRLLAALGELDEAERWQRRAERLDPARVSAIVRHLNRLQLRFADTVQFPHRAETDFINYCQARWQSGDWDGYHRDHARIAALARRRVEAGELPGLWPNYATFFSRQDVGVELAVNSAWGDYIQAHVAPLRARLGFRHAPRGERIRVGLVSPDFRNNAVGHMLTGFLRHMDRRQFELVGYPTVLPGEDRWGRLARELLDEVVDISALDNAVAATRINADGIDVLCDAYGYGPRQRPEIFALRPAPVQILLTGFPGSLGAPWIDYMVATDNLIPEAHRGRYRERVVKVPVSRHVVEGFPVASYIPTRKELGLPEQSLVLACLHRTSKLDPEAFGCWLEVMAEAPDTCLWLLRYTSQHEARLRAGAAAHGIDPERLIFCGQVPLPEHIARLRQADLYLDTFVFGGFNSSAMALYAGVPVVTIAGQSLSTRMAADACRACGLEDTVASDEIGYQAKLRELVGSPAMRAELRQRLADPAGLAFFSPTVTARHMGLALAGMVERHRAGQAPEDFRIRD